MNQLTPICTAQPEKTNWQLHVDQNDRVWSIAIVSGAKSTAFGDRNHLLRLLRQGAMSFDQFNDAGLAFMEGLHHKMIGTGEDQWALLSFAH